MSSSDSDADLIAWWNNASNFINRYFPIFIYGFGILGNFLNVLVLFQPTIRSNPSAVFFSISSIACLLAIVSGLTSRMMSGYAADLTNTVNWICIVRNYVLYTARTIALWLIALATIDRWLSTSADAHRRQMSTLKSARQRVILVLIFSCLINGPIIFLYQAGLTGALRGCYGATYVGRCVTDGIYLFGTTLIPLSIMVSFGLLVIRNVHRTQNRVQNIAMLSLTHENRNTLANEARRPQSRKMEKHLLRMLCVEVTLLILLTCPHAIQKAYTSFASVVTTNTVESAVSTFILNLVTLFNFTASAMPFYIYTLSGGRTFRNAFFGLVKATVLKILCR